MSSPQSLLFFCLRRPCSSCSVLKKYSSEEPDTFLCFPVLPQVMIIDNFWFAAFSFFPFCPYFYPWCTSRKADRAQWYAIAFLCCSFCGFVAMCSWQTRHGERKGSQPVGENKGTKKRTKAKAGILAILYLWGQLGTSFQSKHISEGETAQRCGSTYLQEGVTAFISL